MNNLKNIENIDEILHKVLKKVFQNDNIKLESSMSDIPEWDSLMHIKLLTAIEDEFKIEIDFADTLEMTSTEEIKKQILKYLN